MSSKEFLALANGNIRNIGRGTLRFHGDWFGRPMDNCHVPKSIEVEDQVLRIGFDDNSVLEVETPSGFEIQNKVTAILRARKVIYKYGHSGPYNEGSKYYREYIEEDNRIVKRSGRVGEEIYREEYLEKDNNAVEIIGY